MKIRVYFSNGNVVNYDGDKVAFRDSDGTHFSFSEDPDGVECSYANVLARGPLINWDTVSWVRQYREEEAHEL